MSSELMGWQKHLHLRKESVWGTRSTSNPDIFVPYTDYSISTRVESSQADLFTGVRQRRHNRVHRATLSGALTLPLFGYHVSGKSLAEHLLTWGASAPASPFLDSYSSDLFEADTDNKRHLGLRVASMTLAGDADSGIVRLSMDLQGKEEVGGITPPTLVATHPQPAEFLFDDVNMYLSDEIDGASASGSDEEIDLRSFEIRLENSLQSYHTNSFYPSVLAAGVRKVDFKFSIFKRDNTYDLLRRTNEVTNRACRLVLRGRHLGSAGSGTFTVVEIQFDRLNFSGATDDTRLHDLVTQDIDWISLKPNTTSNEIDFQFSLDS